MSSFVGSFCFIFVFYFHVVKGFVLFVSFVVCVFTACRITSREGTRQRLDGGSRQRFYCRPGVFFFHPSGFSSFFCFFFLGIYLLLCSCYIPLYTHLLSFPFVCFYIFHSSLFQVLFLLHFICASLYFFPSLPVYRGSWYMYVVPVIALQNVMALYCCCLPDTT